MKNSNSKLTLMLFGGLLLGGATLATTSCSDDSDDNTPIVTADKTKLSALIDSTTTLHNGATEGSKPGNFATGSKATFKTAIDAGTATKNNTAATQTVVNTAEAALRRAAKVFDAARIGEVSATNLVAQWKFEGNANDATANGNNGTPKTGYINDPSVVAPAPNVKKMGTAVPTLVADRFGRPNQAYAFDGGAYIEVPYKPGLNPQAITISAWVKRNGTNENNYIVSMDRWQGYKFQLQSTNRPFMTANTITTGFANRDAEADVADNTWAHVATTYVDGTMKFYINGVKVKTWTDVSGAMKGVPQNIPLCIGQQLPNSIWDSAPTGGQPADYYQFYGESFFKGSMDDIRIYNTALSDSDITTIYTVENTL